MTSYPLYFLGCLLIGAFWCYGFFKIFDDLLLPVRAWIEIKLGPKWSKPVVTCPPCMGSLHGLYLHWVLWWGEFSYITIANFFHILVYCVALCGLNYLIQQLLPEYE